MSRFSTFLRRVFRGSAVLGRALAYAMPLVLLDVRAGRAKTDAEIRASAKQHVSAYLALRYPGYEFLIDAAVTAVVDAVRAALRKHSVN